MGGIEAHDLSKRFGDVQALDSVSVSVEPGEIVALLGPNGAGKSTLLRILATTVLADSGTARLAGHDVAGDSQGARTSCGLMLGEERSWYWRISGRHNLEFFSALHGLDRMQARDRTAELLEEVGLVDAADRPFGGYSAGMKARLSLARSLISSPPVLLLDEPTRSLDPIATVSFREMVVRLAEDGSAAVLLATHDLHEASRLPGGVVGLDRGRVAFVQSDGADSAALEREMLASR